LLQQEGIGLGRIGQLAERDRVNPGRVVRIKAKGLTGDDE
jgi:hypothetical protein